MMQPMHDITEFQKCSGCMACTAACKYVAIEVRLIDGFFYPAINNNLCVNCGVCKTVCPSNIAVPMNRYLAAYAAQTKDNNVALNSASGGVVAVLSRYIISHGGVVYGAAFNQEHEVICLECDSIEKLKRIQNSKYVQMNVNGTYLKIKDQLKKRLVLFVGTPCQVAGLYRICGTESKNLITVDLFCRGVPSPELFKKYNQYLISKFGTENYDYSFRDKRVGYGMYPSIKIDTRRKFLIGIDAAYIRALSIGLVRESCFNCKYAQLNRVGDFSVGDFHGKIKGNLFNQMSFTTLLCNSEQAISMFKLIENQLNYVPITVEDVCVGQGVCLSGGLKKTSAIIKIKNEIRNKDYNTIAKDFLIPKGIKGIAYRYLPAKIQCKYHSLMNSIIQLFENGVVK